MDSARRAVEPSPGDGICPSEKDFDSTAAAACRTWRDIIAAASHEQYTPDLFTLVTDLLRHVPPFRAVPSAEFTLLEGAFLQAKCCSEWLTTDDATCDVPWKRSDHYQVLGVLKPLEYQFTDDLETQIWREVKMSQPGVASQLFLAWTYILSSRWVETLQQSGGQAELFQRDKLNVHNFWEVILSNTWRASITRHGRTWYAPWSLKRTHPEAR